MEDKFFLNVQNFFFSTSNKIGIPSDSCVYCQENNHGLHRIWYHIFVVEEIDALLLFGLTLRPTLFHLLPNALLLGHLVFFNCMLGFTYRFSISWSHKSNQNQQKLEISFFSFFKSVVPQLFHLLGLHYFAVTYWRANFPSLLSVSQFILCIHCIWKCFVCRLQTWGNIVFDKMLKQW